MEQFQVNEAQSSIQDAIGYAVHEDRDGVINLLRKNGASIDESISDENLIKVVYLAIAKSNGFKKDFSDYLIGKFAEDQVNYVEEEFFNLTKEERLAARKQKQTLRKEAGGSKVGKALGSVATSENISALVNTGLGVLSKKLTAKADQQSIKDATNLAAQQSQQALNQTKLEEQRAASRKWIVPVVIGGVLVIGAVIFFVIRKKK